MPAITCHQVQYLVTEDVSGEIANEEREVDMPKEGLIKMFAFDVSSCPVFIGYFMLHLITLPWAHTCVHLIVWFIGHSHVTCHPPIPSSFDSENNFPNLFS